MDCLPSSLTLDLPTDLSLTDSHRTNLPLSVDDFATTAVVHHLLASKSEYPNAFEARLPVLTQLNIPVWEFYLLPRCPHRRFSSLWLAGELYCRDFSHFFVI